MVKVGIYGASGYTGQELLRLLLRHPVVELTVVTSRRYADTPVASLFPHFHGLTPLAFQNLTPEEMASLCEVVFLALPHGVSMEVVPSFLTLGKRVIDLSADFRLQDIDTFHKWYGKHLAPAYLTQAVYGLPELYREKIRECTLVANPGCYPTSAILALAPLITESNLIDSNSIIIDAKSGVSGAGREPKVSSLFCEVAEGFKAYNVGKHRHTPEIEQELSRLSGLPIKVTFTPHLLPVNRGILSTVYVTPKKELFSRNLQELYEDFYRGEKFVKVLDEGFFPNISAVRGTNFCHLSVTLEERSGRIIIFSAIDNLMKGAAGQAVQNMNIMLGLPEETGLNFIPAFP